jgi:hypothetical protein
VPIVHDCPVALVAVDPGNEKARENRAHRAFLPKQPSFRRRRSPRTPVRAVMPMNAIGLSCVERSFLS